LKRKIIIGACAAVAVFSMVYVCNTNTGMVKDTSTAEDTSTDSKLSGGGSGSGSFSEIRYSQDKLINESDVIVRCIFTGEKETKTITAVTKNGRGEETGLTAPVTTYKMKTVECLKGSVDDEFEFGLIGTGDRNFIKDGEYVLFLDYNSHNNTYKLVSYSQGFNKVKQESGNDQKSVTQSVSSDGKVSQDEPAEIESVDTNEVMNYQELKNKIKELEK